MSENRITKFHVEINTYMPIFEQPKLIPDEEWVKLNIKEPLSFKIELSDSTKFYDEKGKVITTLQQLVNSLVPKDYEELPPTKKSYFFEKPTFIKTQEAKVPKLKIRAIEVVISKRLSQVEID